MYYTQLTLCSCLCLQFTLPVAVDYGAMDSSLLRRFWESQSAGGSVGGSSGGREKAPPELADRCLIFYRGVDVVRYCLLRCCPKYDQLDLVMLGQTDA